MHILDLIGLILENLGRRKARVALTAIGVVIGTAAVVVLVSLGIGLQRGTTQMLYGIADLTRIDVSPKYDFGVEGGAVSARPIGGGGGGGGGVPTPTPITDQTIKAIAGLPGILEADVRPFFIY